MEHSMRNRAGSETVTLIRQKFRDFARVTIFIVGKAVGVRSCDGLSNLHFIRSLQPTEGMLEV